MDVSHPPNSLCSTGVDAALALDTKRALRFAALAAMVPAPARDGAYNAVADNRYTLFGRLPQQRWTRGSGGGADEEGRFLDNQTC